MSINWIFDAAIEASRRLNAEDARQKELLHLRENARNKCGSCDKWMKSSQCPREQNVNGWNKGPSCNDLPCFQFESSREHLAWVQKYNEARASQQEKK